MKYTLHCKDCNSKIAITYKLCACQEAECREATPIFTCTECGWSTEGESILYMTEEGTIDGI